MKLSRNDRDLPDRMAAAWPAELWRDVHVLVAVSGGADSMALLRGMVQAKRRQGGAGQVMAAHVNHGLRGAASDGDEQWLVEQCQRLDVRFMSRRGEVAALAEAEGDGLEAAARQSRYQLLTEMAETTGARYVAVGHTRDDQIETVLFRVIRGTGLRGLAGIRPTRPLSASVALVRPLLACERSELLAYLHSADQDYREDATNQSLQFARNRLRQELLPYLREFFNPDVDDAIARIAALAGDAQELIETLAEDLLRRCTPSPTAGDGSGRVTLAAAALVDQPEMLVCEALRRAWREAGLPEQAMSRRRWRELAHFAQSPSGASALRLPGKVRATWASPGMLSLAAKSSPS